MEGQEIVPDLQNFDVERLINCHFESQRGGTVL
jgi:hypothetical protein